MIVVTGAAGFIGSHLVSRLLADGHAVLGLDSFTDYYDTSRKNRRIERLLRHHRFRFTSCDLGVDDLTNQLVGATAIYHLAAQPGVRGSWGSGFGVYVRENIIATQRLLEAARDTGARFVFASSSSVYGDAEGHPTPETAMPQPTSPYGVTKLASEQLVMAYHRSFGLDARCVRYFTVYGPGQRPDMAFSRFIRAALAGEEIEIFGDGHQIRDFTYVADAVDATVRAGTVDAPGDRILNVGGGAAVTIREVLAMLEPLVGQTLRVRYGQAQAGDVWRTGADLTRVSRTLGWQPRVSVRDGLERQVADARRERMLDGAARVRAASARVTVAHAS